jgi:hypothetical protein
MMEDILNYLEAAFRQVNYLHGLIIALVAALLMTRWQRVFFFALLTTLVHFLLDVYGNDWRFPNILSGDVLAGLALLYVGYLIFIGFLFAIKSVMVRSGH